ncbi:GNAT family N-acetyltransferase [Cytobacillus purgationiresistens]|uniref:GNAT superfamily N-acetyltransferase n=1 Tax=Cytobacillus purgationiresistens TaxID=863449 RepID=A0ABU0AK76_9BACI|nr:GNAT family N-acetyltransferase [Cytobacillus purgationiresistens]MDQ0271677.1 GNAT superfamily N-acetyltransferase [Cytobacillus purgationiresistens]
MSEYEVKLAQGKDEYLLIHFLKDVSFWLKEKEIDQWGFLAAGGEDDEIREAIRNKQTFLMKKDQRMIATFTLYDLQSEWDIHTWGKLDDQAVYLHRLAVSRLSIGSGIGKIALRCAEEYCKKNGKSILRLDCIENNKKLNQFYLDNGFHLTGVFDEHCKYEKRL